MRLSILICLLTFSTCSFAQVSFGPKAGVIGSTISNDNLTKGTSSVFGFSGGVFGNVTIVKILSFQAEALYSMRGYQFSNTTNSLNYIDVPLLLQFSFGEKIQPFINIGASPSFLMTSKSERVNTFDLAIIASPGVKIKLSDKISTFLEARYYYGTSEVYKGVKAYNRSIGLYTGLVF